MIYHLTDNAAWEAALNRGYYTHPSLKTEGFIHGSYEDQVLDTAARHFAAAEDLLVLHIIDKHVRAHLQVASTDHGDFPHIHARIPLGAIESISMLSREPDGSWSWDKGRL
jgi:uncharacterized protein (DUF952 family)